jgi:hypothetical protein
MENPTDKAFIERPESHEAGALNELYCWMPGNYDRECTGACVGYDPRSTSDVRFTPCTILNTLRSLGLSVMGIANAAKQDVRKTSQPVPPEVK